MRTKKNHIPAALREQLSAAGRARAASMTKEERSLGGRNSWKRRLEVAREAEMRQEVAQEPEPEPPHSQPPSEPQQVETVPNPEEPLTGTWPPQ
jgi:hypothetical protein